MRLEDGRTMTERLGTGGGMSRRAAVAALAGAALLPLAQPRRVGAQDDEAADGGQATLAEVPSFGARRPGPVELAVGTPEATAGRGTPLVPVRMVAPNAGIDAPVETGTITPDGVMNNPSGPWVVTWYDQISAPGMNTNVVMAGHLDYWDTGPAVFWNLPNLPVGDAVSLVMEDGTQFDYAIEWSRLFHVATELTPEVIQTEVVGDTGRECLTLITCGGEFDYTTGEYLYRYVVRTHKV